MVRKIKNQKTADERRAQAEQLQASIAGQVEELRSSEQWLRFLAFAQSFHRYSLGNLLLILEQRPTATRVAGFRQWQAKGRQVRKGERAIRIFGYAQKKVTADQAADQADGKDTETVETTEDGHKVITYYPVLSVFDIDQTDPIDPNSDDPSTLAQRLDSHDELGIVEAVTDYLTGEGWNVEHQLILGGTDGYTDPERRRVVIDADLSPADAAATILHEAAHVILHAEEDLSEYIEHRGIKETEAESVAYVVAGLLGMDTSRTSIGYLAGWAQGEAETIKATAVRVLHAAHTLAEGITEAITEVNTDAEAAA